MICITKSQLWLEADNLICNTDFVCTDYPSFCILWTAECRLCASCLNPFHACRGGCCLCTFCGRLMGCSCCWSRSFSTVPFSAAKPQTLQWLFFWSPKLLILVFQNSMITSFWVIMPGNVTNVHCSPDNVSGEPMFTRQRIDKGSFTNTGPIDPSLFQKCCNKLMITPQLKKREP